MFENYKIYALVYRSKLNFFADVLQYFRKHVEQ